MFDDQALQACVPEQRPVEVTDNWPSSKQLESALSLTKLSFDCQSPGWPLSNRYLLVDSRDPQRPLLAIGQRQGEARIDFIPQQPISPELQQQWQQALQKYPKLLEPFDPSTGQLSVKPYAPEPGAEQVWAQFRQLHAQLRDAKDKAPGIVRVEAFFTRHDFRAIAAERSSYPGLLNDIAYWATEAGRLQSARPWLAWAPLMRITGRSVRQPICWRQAVRSNSGWVNRSATGNPITRTHTLGELTDNERTYYTYVLKSHIDMAKLQFLNTCTGGNLDSFVYSQLVCDFGSNCAHRLIAFKNLAHLAFFY